MSVIYSMHGETQEAVVRKVLQGAPHWGTTGCASLDDASEWCSNHSPRCGWSERVVVDGVAMVVAKWEMSGDQNPWVAYFQADPLLNAMDVARFQEFPQEVTA